MHLWSLERRGPNNLSDLSKKEGQIMATFVAHGLVGAAATTYLNTMIGIVSKRGLSKRVYWINVAVGFFLGSMNDTIDRVASWITGSPQYGPIYQWFHHDMPTWFMVVFYQSGLHYVMDKPFHKIPGANWWPVMWMSEVVMWIMPGMILSLCYLIVIRAIQYDLETK